MAYKEHHLQSVCVQWFRLAYPHLWQLLFAVPNGARRTQWEAQQLRAEGMVAGVADMMLLCPSADYHAACIEFKTQTETWRGGKKTTTRTYQRDTQKEWQKAVETHGYRYIVVRTFDEFKEFINEYLKDNEFERVSRTGDEHLFNDMP